MSSSDGSSGSGSSGSGSSGSSDQEDEQHVQQVVTGANADPQVLQYFWDLASLQQDERQAAAAALVAALVDSQKQYDSTHRAKGSIPAGGFDQEAGNRQQRMEQCLSCCSPLMGYGLKRLARGLASSRQGARQGFAAALAATLAYSAAAASDGAVQQQKLVVQQPFVSAAGVLALLDACLEVTGSMKGTDQRDTLLGRVFGLAALTRSGLIKAVPSAADGTINSSPAAVLSATAVVAEQLAGLLQRKSFLRESAAAGLVELLQGLDQQQLGSVLQQAPKTSALLQAAPSAASPESLFLCLRLWHAMPAQQLQQCQLLPKVPTSQAPPQVFWEQPSAVKRTAVVAAAAGVFSAEQVQRMTPALLLSTASSPRLHPVWGCLLALLVPGFVPVKGHENPQQKQQQQRRSPPDSQQLQALWRHFVEGACLSSSHERKALAIQLLQLLMPVMGPDMVPVLLSKQLLGCVATALKDKESYLHASAKRCMDRLSTAADHSQVVQDDPAAAARLRLALAAALQSANLVAPGSKGAKTAKMGPLQGLDAAGVADYVNQSLQDLVQAAQGAQSSAQANGAQHSDEDSEEAEDAAADDGKVLQQLEQMVAALKLPSADTPTLRKGLSFLAALSWLTLPASFDAAAAGASKKAGKKKQKQDKAAAGIVADAVLQQEDVQAGLQLAASIQPQPSGVLQRTAAARLVGLLHHLHSRAGALLAAAAHQKQPKQQQDGKQQKAGQSSAQQDATAAARAAAAQAADALTNDLLSLFTAAQKLPDVAVTVDEDIAEMVEQLGQLSDAVEQHVPSAPAAGTHSSHQQQQATAAARKRVVLHLVHQLQLQLLSRGLSAETAGSVVDDLEVSVLRGLGLNGQLLEQLRAADAQAKLKLAGAAAEASDSEEDAAAAGSDGDSDDDDDDGSAWQDVLLDLLLSLLSSSSSSESSGSRGVSVFVPSVPLREACEVVFKVFAEDMTAQGISDLLRVLSQRASEVLKPAEEEEDDMEVEQSEGEGDSSGSEDDASDLDEEQQQQLKDLHKKTAADSDSDSGDTSEQTAPAANGTASPSAKSPAAADGSDSESDDGLDDEAMLRMDAQLGAAVRASLSRSGGSAKERAAALLALQLRVAALLEDWLKKCPRSPILLSVVLPLLKALVSARGTGGNPVLADRLAGLVTKHLARARPVFPAQDADTAAAQVAVTALEADMRKVMYYASRDKDARVCAAAAQSLLVLIGAGSEAGDAAAGVAQATAAAALQDFLQHKKSRLQQNWCQQLLSRCFDAVAAGEGAGLQALLTACSKGRNEAIRSKSVQLLPSLVTGKQPQQVAVLLAGLKQHQGLLASALGAGVVGPYKNKDQHAAAVKAVVALLGGVVKQGGGKRLAELVGSETVRELGKSVVVVKAAGVPPKVEGQLDRLVETAGLQQLVSAGKPDPARLALLNKARAALEAGAAGKPGAANGAAAAAAAAVNGSAGKGGKQQGGQGEQGKKQQQKDKAKRKAEPAAADAQQAASGQHKKHKKQQLQEKDDAAGQQDQPQQQQQQRHKKKEKVKAVAAGDQGVAAVAEAAAEAAEVAQAGGKGSSKRKHTAAEGAEGVKGGAKKKKDKHHKHKQVEQ